VVVFSIINFVTLFKNVIKTELLAERGGIGRGGNNNDSREMRNDFVY
jgi:hypothetical protein